MRYLRAIDSHARKIGVSHELLLLYGTSDLEGHHQLRTGQYTDRALSQLRGGRN